MVLRVAAGLPVAIAVGRVEGSAGTRLICGMVQVCMVDGHIDVNVHEHGGVDVQGLGAVDFELQAGSFAAAVVACCILHEEWKV